MGAVKYEDTSMLILTFNKKLLGVHIRSKIRGVVSNARKLNMLDQNAAQTLYMWEI